MNMYRPLFALFALASAAFAQGCSKEKDKGDSINYGAPAIAPIVDSVTPEGLKSGGANLKDAQVGLTDSAASEASFKSYITKYVFKKDTTGTVAGPVFYRYWIDKLDEGMAEINSRIAGSEDTPERCWNQALVSVTHTFNVGSEQVSTVGRYNCFEEPAGAASAGAGGIVKTAFGKDETYFYFMSLTRDAAVFGPNQGERVILARATADASTAEIWFIGRSLQSGPAGSHIRGVANRIMADKKTGAFSYALSDEGIGSTNCAMFGRSDGSKLNFQARTPLLGSSTQCQDVENMTWGVGGCYDAKTLATATGCETLATVPTGFGVSAPFVESDVGEVKAGSEAIIDTDYAALGITKF